MQEIFILNPSTSIKMSTCSPSRQHLHSQPISIKLSTKSILMLLVLFLHTLYWPISIGAEQIRHGLAVSSPGETTLKLEIGIGDDANITCRIFDGDSRTLEFLLVNTQERITQSSGLITLLDDGQTAVLSIRNATEEKWLYRCMSGKHVIGETYVYVGTPPANITDFTCRGYDYRFITCTFTTPPNMVLTSYTLRERLDRSLSHYYHFCNLTTMQPNIYQCNFTSSNGFYPSKDKYFFNLTATNALGHNSQTFNISYSENVIPAPLHIKITGTTDDSVILSWNFEQRMYYKYGVLYDIRLKPDLFDWFNIDIYKNPRCENIVCQLKIENLSYPYWKYEISIRIKAATSKNDEHLWSSPWVKQFMTKARPPDLPPAISPGSYHIDDADEKEIRLYWQKLETYQENGPNFHYIIESYDEEGQLLNKNTTTLNSATYPYQRDQDILYYIKAANSMGESSKNSHIRVFHAAANLHDYTPRTIATIYHNHIYEISWQPPVIDDPQLNYTVYWCLSKIESRNQCKGSIYFENLNRTTTTYTTKPQNQTLNVAVSANYPNQNSGMHWTNCSADAASDLNRLEPRVTSPTNSSISLEWTLENICPSIVKGYKLLYCEISLNVEDLETSECANEPIFMQIPSKQNKYQNQTIRHLKPFTNYRISILMYSDTKTGPTVTVHHRTKEAAPSAPRNLQLISVTSESVRISWQPPYNIPGHFQFYTIWWRSPTYKDSKIIHFNDTEPTSSETDPDTVMYYTLDSLKSYTQYRISVTAHTVEASEPSDEIYVTTKIGIPSEPKDIRSESDSNFGELQWQRPELPSGRVEFYVVELIQKSRQNNRTEFKAISFVTNPYCRYSAPKCKSSDEFYFLQVHAVNMAKEDEVDIFGGAENELIKTKLHNKLQQATESPFICENSEIPTTPVYQRYLENWKIIGGNGQAGQKYYPSPAGSSTEIYCSEFPIKVIMVNILSIILGVLIFITVTIWSRRKIKKMKNIEAVLPDGLMNHIPNCKLSNTDSTGGIGCRVKNEKDTTNIACSFDCLVYSNAKEEQRLTGNNSPYKDVANNLKFLQDQEIVNYEIKDDRESLDEQESNEEQSTESTNSVELTDNNTPLKVATTTTTTTTTNNDYITHLAPLISNAQAEPNPFTPLMPCGGYVQPQALAAMFSTQQPQQQQQQQQQQQSSSVSNNINGYTSIEALSKVGEQQVLATIAKDASPVDGLGTEDGFKDITVTLATGNANNNGNNNSICGYVTQQQLAQYGQLLH